MCEKKNLVNDSFEKENPELSKIYKELNDFCQVLEFLLFPILLNVLGCKKFQKIDK